MRSVGVEFEEWVHSKTLLKRCLSQVVEFVLHYPNYQYFQGKTVGMTLIVRCGNWRGLEQGRRGSFGPRVISEVMSEPSALYFTP